VYTWRNLIKHKLSGQNGGCRVALRESRVKVSVTISAVLSTNAPRRAGPARLVLSLKPRRVREEVVLGQQHNAPVEPLGLVLLQAFLRATAYTFPAAMLVKS
jgi:hypothetical protein